MDLVVRVRAAGDSSLASVFRPLLAASAQAQRQVEAAASRSGKATQSIYRESGRAAVQAADQAARAAEKSAGDEVRSRERALAHVARIRERYFREEQRRGEQADKLAAQNAAKAIARNQQVASAALRTFGGLARRGLSAARDIARGFGVDLSLAGGLSRGMQLESAAVAIANKGNRGGAVEDPKALEALARRTGEEFKVDPNKVLAGLDKFQSLTGDLNLGKLALRDLTGLSKAFKIDLDKMIGSAGNVATKIGDVGKEFKTPEEKAKAILAVMKSLVAQGQEGAIEMPDLVTQLSALGAAAPRFEGSAAANISKMGAMAQLALQMGGAKSASQATTAVMGFANTLSTPARRAKFAAMGVDIDSKTEKGKFADPFEIIKRSLTATGGDTDKMKKLFANVVGERAVRALTNAFLGAGGGDKGLAAVDKQFARFGGTVTDKQISENLTREKGTQESQAVEFQNQLDLITASLGQELAPALKDLGPVALSAAKGLSGLVSFGVSHPEMAITAAIVASIGKAALGEAAGKALGSALSNMTAGGGIAIGAAAIAVTAATIAIHEVGKGADAGHARIAQNEAVLGAAEAEYNKTGTLSPETAARVLALREQLKKEKAAGQDAVVNESGTTLGGISAGFRRVGRWISSDQSMSDIGEASAYRERMGNVTGQEKGADALLRAVGQNKPPTASEIGTATAAALAPLINKAGGSGPTPNEGARSGGVN